MAQPYTWYEGNDMLASFRTTVQSPESTATDNCSAVLWEIVH